MNFSFQTGPLSESLVAEALPLVQTTWPATDLVSWRRYIRPFSGEAAEAGLLAMRDSAGCLCGLLAYSLYRPLGPGLVLVLPLFTAVDVANSLEAVRALLGAAEKQASALQCTSLEIRLDRGQSQLADRLRSLGLSAEASLLGKVVPRWVASS
jgi:hypothetical protein